MENAEEVMQILERFTRLKQKEIPKELDEYLQYVAKTGDTVFKWSNLKYLFREKLLNVITHFHDTTPRVDEIPQYPNVDPFNYESMKSSLLERLELFNAAPFTIQRLCELLIDPKKQYNRIDKFMRALEKNILVSTVEPGRKRTESENGDSLDSVVNGDISLDVNVDIDMENESLFSMEATQNGNGTAAAVSPVGAAESTNDTESVSDTKLEDESDAVVNVTSTHEPPTGDDEDLQPSPKKVKLDADAEVADAAAQVVKATTKPVEKAEEVIVEKVEATKEEVAREDLEKKKEVETQEEKLNKPAECNVNKEESTQVTEKPAITDEVKGDLETETKVVSEDKIEAANETKKDETIKSTSDTTPAEATTTTKTDNEKAKERVEVDANNSSKEAKLSEISSAVEKNEPQETAEKIIEKQEIEKCEKEVVNTEVESSIEKEVPTQSENGKTVEGKPSAVEADIKESTSIDKKSSEEVNNEAEVVSDKTVAPKVTLTPVNEAVEAANKIENETEKLITSSSSTTITASEAKTEDIETCVTTTDDIENVEAVPKIAESATTITSTSSNETPTTSEVDTTSKAAIPAAPIDEELPAVKTDAVEKTTAESTVAPDASAAVAIVSPTLALNDQPMEEDAITNVVDEIVMAETISTTSGTIGDGIEMATDSMEATISSDAAKVDDPADGMDVDDTSPQEEAMDQ